MPKTTPAQAHKEYLQVLKFMYTHNYLKINKRNERFLLGDHWHGLKVKMLDTPIINVIKRIIDFKIATILSPIIAVLFTPQGFVETEEGVEEDPSKAEKKAQMVLAMESFNAQIKQDAEHIGQDDIDEDVLTSSAIGGMALAYYWWDNKMITGNEEIAVGGVKGKQVDGINFFPANPSQYISGNFDNLEDQEYIILTYDTSVYKAKQIARTNGIDEEEIAKITSTQKDANTTFDKGENEVAGSETVTIKVRMYMGEAPEEPEEETGIDLEKKEPDELEAFLGKPMTVRFQQFTEHVEIQKDTDTKLSIYPVAPMYWDKRKNFIYGKPEISSMITNQVFLNKILAMAMASLARTAFPKLLYDADRVRKPTNTLGGALGISGLLNQGVQGAIGYLEGKGVAQDVFQLFDKVLAVTKDVHGANENALGEARPENTSAAIAQQKQANVPLRSLRNRYKRYRERCARIQLNFYLVNFNTPRQLAIKDKTGAPKSITFTGTDFAMVNWHTKVDMPETTQFSESLAITVLMEMLNAEMISFRQFLERYPEGIIPKKGELLNEVKAQEAKEAEAQANGDDFDQLSQIFQGLNEQQRKAVLNSNDPAQAVRDIGKQVA